MQPGFFFQRVNNFFLLLSLSMYIILFTCFLSILFLYLHTIWLTEKLKLYCIKNVAHKSQKIKNIPIYVTAIQLYLFDAIMKYCTLQQSTTQTLDTEKK